jgi:hypothetical protein
VGSLDTLRVDQQISLRDAVCEQPAIVEDQYHVGYRLKFPGQKNHKIIIVFGQIVADALYKAGSLSHDGKQSAMVLTATDSLSVVPSPVDGSFVITLPKEHPPYAALFEKDVGVFAFIKW